MRRHLLILVASLAVAIAASGCGTSRPPTSPAPAQRSSSGADVMAASAAPAGDFEPGVIVWAVVNAADEDDVETELELDRIGTVEGYSVCRLPAGSDPILFSQQMMTDPRVAWAEPNHVVETAESRGHPVAFDDGRNDASGYDDQTAARRVGLAAAHRVSKGTGVIVALLDTGVNGDHPLLAGHVLPGFDFVAGDGDASEAPDAVDSDGDGQMDEALGHGTHVAGIVALTAPGARILPLKVLDDDGRGTAVDVALAIDYALAHGARVLNLSLGMLAEDYLVKSAVNRARDLGVVVVASAGNWGAEHPEEYPANFEATTAVAATGPADAPASFSSYGGFVALSAPGEGIRSSYWNGHTAVWSGTSMAAPFVAGGAALLLALHPEWARGQVLARLYATAAPLDPAAPEAAHFGVGRLDLAAATAPDVPGSAGGGIPASRPID